MGISAAATSTAALKLPLSRDEECRHRCRMAPAVDTRETPRRLPVTDDTLTSFSHAMASIQRDRPRAAPRGLGRRLDRRRTVLGRARRRRRGRPKRGYSGWARCLLAAPRRKAGLDTFSARRAQAGARDDHARRINRLHGGHRASLARSRAPT